MRISDSNLKGVLISLTSTHALRRGVAGVSGGVAWPVADFGKGDGDRRWLWEKGEAVRQVWEDSMLYGVGGKPARLLKETRFERENFCVVGPSVWSQFPPYIVVHEWYARKNCR